MLLSKEAKSFFRKSNRRIDKGTGRAMVSHFTYGVAYLWCVAYLSGVDKGTGTYYVRNAVGTLYYVYF
jgi:hypothetical protein